ncbi:MAG: hypothetical protein KDE68_08840 [Rhodocyclaceae bacterium]|nr:hypothetical protein [Rhodocyclaceae bacterium]
MAELHSADVTPYLSDIGGYLTACTDTFLQVGAILRQAALLTEKHTDLNKLISAAEFLVDDMGNSADCWSEEVKEKEFKND